MHPRARTTPWSRAQIVRRFEAGQPVSAIASAFGISRQTVYKWLSRWRDGGLAALGDRRPIARTYPTRLPGTLERQIRGLRCARRMLGREIAAALQVPRSTVIKVLKRLGIARLSALEMPLLIQRYEYANPGEMVHIDIKKLGRIGQVGHRIHGRLDIRSRGVGWEHVYVCVDDATRLAYLEVRLREDRFEASEFLESAAQWFAAQGVRFQRVMTDNGKVFGSHRWREMLQKLHARHVRTRPYHPRTNGKAERFIQTMLRECAYGIAFANSDERRAALSAWNRYYNEERPHSALKLCPPALGLRLRQQCLWS
jgi:transposase InsO family protein